MKDSLSIGPTPSGESCQQVGTDNYNPRLAKAECRIFIEQLKRQFGEAPDGAAFVIRGQSHDFGRYFEVEVEYDEENDLARAFAFKVESNTPEYWDEMAKVELAAAQVAG